MYCRKSGAMLRGKTQKRLRETFAKVLPTSGRPRAHAGMIRDFKDSSPRPRRKNAALLAVAFLLSGNGCPGNQPHASQKTRATPTPAH